MLTSSKTSSPPDVIINTCDPMQNLGQTRIFYKAGQTRLTWMTRMTNPVSTLIHMEPAYTVRYVHGY